MLEVQFEKATTLKKIVDSIFQLASEVNFDFTSTGLAIQAMDKASVSLIVMMLKSDFFADFRVDRNVTLGINLTSLQTILKVADNDDIVTMRAHDTNSDVVTFVFENSGFNEGFETDKSSTFQLKLTNIEQDKLGIPDANYDAVVIIPAGEFQHIISSLGSLGDTISIGVGKEGISFSVSGDIGSGTTLVKRNNTYDNDNNTVSIINDKEVSLAFACRYLAFFTKATALSNQVKISISNNLPMVVKYPIVDPKTKKDVR